MRSLRGFLLGFGKLEWRKLFVSRETYNTVLILAIITFSFFPIRHVFFTDSAYITGAYSDFTSFSLYLSDIFTILLFLFNIPILKIGKPVYLLLLFVIWSVVCILSSHTFLPLEIYFLAKFIELFVLFTCIGQLKYSKKLIFVGFLSLISIQSILAIWQFLAQKSIGLHLLGESHIGPTIDGVAKIVSYGTVYIRAYGTFPHSNILSAFLMVGILGLIIAIYRSDQIKRQLPLFALLFISFTALVLTFSRAAYLATTISTVILLFVYTIKNGLNLKTGGLVLGLILFTLINLGLFHNYLITRATVSDNAVKERVFYNNIGLSMVKDQPLTGLGVGDSVLHMQQYSSAKLEPWEIQPIHNYYLITTAETGLVGLIILLGLFGNLGISLLIKTIRTNDSDVFIRSLFLGSILAGFLVLMLFDHYFYTIESTQLLFWIVLGIIYSEVGKKVAQETI